MTSEEMLAKLCDEINARLWDEHQKECAKAGRYSGWSPFDPDAHRSVRVVFELFNVFGLHRHITKLEADIRCMVEKAADKDLAGYRELGAQTAQALDERDDARREVAELTATITEMRADAERKKHGHAGALRELENTRVRCGLLEKEVERLKAFKTRVAHMYSVRYNYDTGEVMADVRAALIAFGDATP